VVHAAHALHAFSPFELLLEHPIDILDGWASSHPAEGEARLVATARRMAEAAFPDCAAALEPQLASLERSTTAARRSQGVRLYWRAVSGLAAAEAARPSAGADAAAAVLSAPLFHRCVAACAFECVASAYRMVRMAGGGRVG
jgi:hypothetical protein